MLHYNKLFSNKKTKSLRNFFFITVHILLPNASCIFFIYKLELPILTDKYFDLAEKRMNRAKH